VRLGPRWKKVAGDIVQSQGRLAMMLAAIVVGVFAVAAISTAYAILGRELDRSYLATNPATALLDVSHLDAAAVAGARQQAGVAWAESGGRVSARIEVRANTWLPMLLFVVPDFTNLRIATMQLEGGRWPSEAPGIALERTAVSVAATALGGKITVRIPNGVPHTLVVTGVVHDPSLAPAWQEQTVYGYVTPATLRLLDEGADLHVLKLIAREPTDNPVSIEHSVVDTAKWLRRAGYAVGEIRIPPHHHPHQWQMISAIRMLLAFSILTLILGAILTATLMASLLAPQVRQIAVMKAIGANTAQIMGLYVALVTAIGIVAVSLGLPLGIMAGRELAQNIAGLLNLDLASLSVSHWIYIGQALAGVGLPLLIALIPIRNATRRTVRESLNDFGVASSSRLGFLARWTSRIKARDPALVLAVRNSVRRKARLVLTLALLATAGALFLTSLNVKAAWRQNLIDAARERHFDTEIQFARAAPAATAVAVVSALPGVAGVEPFSEGPAALDRPDGLNIVKTYPDGGHGSLRVDALPPDTAFVNPTLIDGQWLGADLDGAVLNRQALPFFPGLRIGDPIRVTVGGVHLNLRIQGIVREHMTHATVYVSSDTYARAMSAPGMTQGIRVALKDHDENSAIKTAAAIESSLENSGSGVAESTSQAQLGRALAGHLFILILIMIMTSILMAFVGLLGLAAAMATGVLERTREFAVMRAVGASRTTILLSVVGEGAVVGVLSVAAAALLSAPLTVAVSYVVGTGSLGSAFGAISAAALPLWLGITLTGAGAASVYPAWRASRLTIREALSYQ
jgi:putative ABC transport system permease protein